MTTGEQRHVDLSVVLPCLNEVRTVVDCIREIRHSLDGVDGLVYEVIIADNGSDDGTEEVVRGEDVRLVHVSPAGYGCALRGGIQAASGEYVLFVDADGTYCYEDSAKLYLATKQSNAAMGVASRNHSMLEERAMPFLHRYLGTPVLSFLLRKLYGGERVDCNSGFRCVKRASFEHWDLLSSGMEFASELLIKALKSGEGVIEIQSGLKTATDPEQSKLSTWRDGMRHLMTILAGKPELFERAGLYCVIMGSLLQILALFLGPVVVGPVEVFDVHSRLLVFVAGLLGAQLYGVSFLLYAREDTPPLYRMTRWLIGLGAEVLLLVLSLLGVVLFAGIGGVFVMWMLKGFHGIDHANVLIVFLHFTCLPGVLAFALAAYHLSQHAEGFDQIVIEEE